MAQTTFAWQGRDRAGRRVQGEIEAADARFARALLRRDGIVASRIRAPKPAGAVLRFGHGKRIGALEVALFSRQMATMMRAGVPLVQAFDMLASDARNPRLAEVVQSIRADVSTGATLAGALGKFPALFDALFRNLVNVGEQTGTLDSMLDRIALDQERGAAIRRKVRKALTYPVLVAVAALVVTGILLIHVVPQFEAVFSSVGGDLPGATRLVIRLSDFAGEWWWAVLGVIGAVAASLAMLAKRSARFREGLDAMQLKVPVAGRIASNAATARFARTLSTAIAAGVPLVEALGAIAGATGNAVYARAVQELRDAVASGQPLHAAMRDSGVFADMAVRMAAVGEESGRLDDMLARGAEQFEERVAEAVDQLTALIEPLTMAVLGVLVGGLLIAMYLPVFQLGGAMGG